ncbi:MAG TPA: class I SAM-dependent RNA methyltransferase [Myxococcales bacterium]|nr:class I SAM-dependent RNA methyltransferase [Myxococcales bacterium]
MNNQSQFEPYLYAVSPPGLEQVTAKELKALGARRIKVQQGGVTFGYSHAMLARANIWLRSASRVLKIIAEQEVRTFPQLIHLTESLDWKAYLSSDRPINVQVSTQKSRLYHSDAVKERIEGVLGARSGTEEEQGIWVRIVRDKMTVSVDTSGELLHRRGYRQAVTKAPIRENVAAALLMACRWDMDSPLIDPMCGSGTFAIEAAWIAQGRAPGLLRTFAFEKWPLTEMKLVRRIRAEAEEEAVAELPTIIGCDIDGDALSAAEQNAERAGVELQWAQLDARDLPRPEGPTGLVIANPPYGKRLRGTRAPVLFQQLHSRFEDWRVVYLHAGRSAPAGGFKPLLSFKNGGINVSLMTSPRPPRKR